VLHHQVVELPVGQPQHAAEFARTAWRACPPPANGTVGHMSMLLCHSLSRTLLSLVWFDRGRTDAWFN
jgi:hypothetical protein